MQNRGGVPHAGWCAWSTRVHDAAVSALSLFSVVIKLTPIIRVELRANALAVPVGAINPVVARL